ncbi:hypothetical protein Pfo_020405 [Paulownia fortunei]|nr:hypothetical protein Pfo_020405 [Paulownia fortunei]
MVKTRKTSMNTLGKKASSRKWGTKASSSKGCFSSTPKWTRRAIEELDYLVPITIVHPLVRVLYKLEWARDKISIGDEVLTSATKMGLSSLPQHHYEVFSAQTQPDEASREEMVHDEPVHNALSATTQTQHSPVDITKFLLLEAPTSLNVVTQ